MPSSHSQSLNLEIKIDGASEVPNDQGGAAVPLKDGMRVTHFTVDQRVDSPDFFEVEFQMMDDQEIVLLDKVELGKPVEISAGYGDDFTVIFQGEISYVEPRFSADANRLVISGYDFLHRLTRGQNSRVWGEGVELDQERKAMAGDLIKDSKARQGGTVDGLSADSDGGTAKTSYAAQYNQSDWDALLEVAGFSGATVDIRSADDVKKVLAKPIDFTADPVVTVTRENQKPEDAVLALSAEFKMSTVRQVAKVEVRGWNPKEKKPILGVCEKVTSAFSGTTGPEAAGVAHYGPKTAGRVVTVVDRPVEDDKEAKELATSIFDQLAMQYTTGTIVIEGHPGVRAGDIVEVTDNFGKRFSGMYLIEGCTHSYTASSSTKYITRMAVARNACPDP